MAATPATTTKKVRKLVIGNTAVPVEGKPSTYKWSMFVREESGAAVKLEAVKYKLHPTFKPHCVKRTRDNADHPEFSMSRTGWGTFAVGLDLMWADGQTDCASHELEWAPEVAHEHVFDDAKAAEEAEVASGGGMGEQEMSDPGVDTEAPVNAPPPPAEAEAVPIQSGAMLPPESARMWHGYRAEAEGGAIYWPKPECITESADLARPDYTKIKSAEFCDTPEVLEKKAEFLVQMWLAAEHPVVYAGAGLSTSSGIWDYASNAKGSAVQPKKKKLTMPFINSLKPTPAHRVLTAMEKKGMIWAWLQQNHDGLAQKAGFPAHKVNELHGSWLDKAGNPIIKMSGSLRDDLFNWLLEMEKGLDFTFAVGTSLSGLNSDRLAQTAAKRHMEKGKGQGLAIISIQKTPYDDVCALRIYSKIDDFMVIVASKLGLLPLDKTVHPYSPAPKPVGVMKEDAWKRERELRRKTLTGAPPKK